MKCTNEEGDSSLADPDDKPRGTDSGSTEDEPEEILENVGGIQFEVYPKFDDNFHISMDKRTRYPAQFGRKYNKTILPLTPSESKLKKGDNIYLFTHSIPRSMFQPIVVADLLFLQRESDVVHFQSTNHKTLNRVYAKWIEYAFRAQKDAKYLIVREMDTFTVEMVENGVDDILKKYKKRSLCMIGADGVLKRVDEHKSLEEQGVELGDLVIMKKPPGGTGSMSILVRTIIGEECECFMNPNDTIQDVKELLQDMEFGCFPIALINAFLMSFSHCFVFFSEGFRKNSNVCFLRGEHSRMEGR